MPFPFLLDLLLALAAALAAVAAVAWASRSDAVPADLALAPAKAAGEAIRPHGRLRALVTRRLDRSVATGFLLTLALAVALAGGVLLGLLAYLIRSLPALRHLDRSVAAWGFDHRTPFSSDALRAITDLGTAPVVVAVAVAIAALDFVRTRGRWSPLFLVVVLGGIGLITLGVKDLAGRARPAFVPQAAHLGPSFPSGHSSTSAAAYAALALVLGRRLAPPWRRLLGAAAVGIAVAVAASRVLLDLHWLSDVIGGLALGWGWFALCAAVFGGRLLRPTAAAEVTTRAAATRRRPAPREAGPPAG